MQPDLEQRPALVGLQEPRGAKQGVLARKKNYSSHEVEQRDEQWYLPDTEALATQKGKMQALPIGGLRRKQWRPSPMMWCLTVMIGDGVVLVALFIVVLAVTAPLHVALHISSDTLSVKNATLIWVCLALLSWSTAVNITKAQDLSCVAGLLKSPLWIVATLILMLIFWQVSSFFLLGNEQIPYIWSMLVFLGLAIPAFSIWRMILAEIMIQPRFRRQAIIVGVNTEGEILARELHRAKHPGVTVRGYINENLDERTQLGGLPILGGKSMLHYLARSDLIDMIIMAIDYKVNPELFQEAFEASQFGVSVVPMSVIYEGTSGKIPVEHIVDQWYVALQSERVISPLYFCWHMLLDLVFGICGLVVLGLLLPILALAIRLDSPGPVFYSQERAGYRGGTFRILKFRSMCSDADRLTAHGQWVSKGDARVTRVGRFLRATHLDELPQVLNILRGEMSLIGPRPERPDYVAQLEKSNSFYSYRLSLKPGLTGWAQVKYGYGVAEQDELVKLQYDLYYIKYRSFLMDVLILLKTVGEVVFCHGV
jgi:exopolysaccharide biosynthesis polyprenyl glycosylphosphotransferase